jgi:hypothetical protein
MTEKKIQRTRSIPPSTLEAQVIASRTASELLGQVQQENHMWVTRRNTERESSVTKKRLTIRKQQKQRSAHSAGMVTHSAVRSATALVVKEKKEKEKQESEIETLFTELCVDLIEQRKQIPANEQEMFDEKWGYGSRPL